MTNTKRLCAIARKEAIQLRRDPKSLMLAFLLPTLLLILFGYAITWDVEDIKTAVVDFDNSAQSRKLLDSFRSAGYFTITAYLQDTSRIASLLERGKAQVCLVIPPDFSSELNAGRCAMLQVIVDGSDANTATIILGYTRSIVEAYSARMRIAGASPKTPLRVQSRVWYNEEVKSRNMIVPGLIPVIMMIIAAMLTSLTIAREWERGTMEQLASTPVSRVEVVLGKLFPYMVIGIIDLVVSCVIGVLMFGVPFRGDPLLLFLMSLVFLVGVLGLGMFISAVAKSQLLATQIALVTTFLPAFLLSGFMFRIEVMPQALQLLSYLVPARYFLVITRGIFLKGVGMEVLYTQGILLVVFSVIGLGVAVSAFRKEID
ncbi:MAG: ABC transporter permease [Candidatus Glassbacteria bacterium]